MSLRTLLSQRRYRRLSVALFAALMVHLCLVFMGNFGILLFSTPSNQDRLLTLTLKSTTYEGLKETSVKEKDTINDAKLGDTVKSAKKVQPQPESKLEIASKKIKETPADNNIDKAITKKTQSNFEPKNQVAPTESSMPTESATEFSQKQPKPSDSPSVLLTSTELSELKVNEQPLVEVIEPIENQPTSNELAVNEVKMLDKKIQRWSSSISSNLASQEPLIWEEDGQQYTASFTELPAETDMDTDQVIIEIATDRDGQKLTTTLRLKKMAFSNFTQFVHQWDRDVSVHNDEMNGRFHSNTRLNLIANKDGAPLFHGKVTTASYFIDIDGNVPRKDIFLGGLERGVKKIAMPKPNSLFNQTQADSEVNYTLIENSSRIIFKPDGSYLLQTLNEIGVMQRHPIGDRPLYILAAPGVNLTLSGTVNGAVTVYSPERIFIEGNLEYLNTGHIDSGGDFLGLISGRSVTVAKRKIVPTGDLTIQAAIYAKNRFEVSQFTGKRAGTLNILGSISAGSLTATEPRYTTNIVFDPRLETLRPPGFPVTDRYELLAKQNNWQVDEDPFYQNTEEIEQVR